MSDPGGSFDRILDELLDDPTDAVASRRPVFARVLGSTALPLEEVAPGRDTMTWNAAMEWAVETSESETSTPVSPPPSADPDHIRRELGLRDGLSTNDLHRLRRDFMWANHPDRRPEWPEALAGRRVAVANMLIDQALDAASRGASRE